MINAILPDLQKMKPIAQAESISAWLYFLDQVKQEMFENYLYKHASLTKHSLLILLLCIASIAYFNQFSYLNSSLVSLTVNSIFLVWFAVVLCAHIVLWSINVYNKYRELKLVQPDRKSLERKKSDVTAALKAIRRKQYAGIVTLCFTNLLIITFMLWCTIEGSVDIDAVCILTAMTPLLLYILTSELYWQTMCVMAILTSASLFISAILQFNYHAWYIFVLSIISSGILYPLRNESLYRFHDLLLEDSSSNHGKKAHKRKSDNLGSIIGTVSHDIKSQLLPLALGTISPLITLDLPSNLTAAQ